MGTPVDGAVLTAYQNQRPAVRSSGHDRAPGDSGGRRSGRGGGSGGTGRRLAERGQQTHRQSRHGH
ncbi:hypothetical protein NW249_32775 [Streptomyces sp. OUCMDZ-4982]|uniref:hypothetical protein n=1 Tax=Streptomyces sp. OUCMDZ-4982 TaxID=2973090 RepID=UPI00215C31F1|nr:hypothetical protein [Streptomyces sp. OUCMDZ-4982]MCR8946878.1 hypothetical protein [Streptomyces sp. OUCMDZ-4982]